MPDLYEEAVAYFNQRKFSDAENILEELIQHDQLDYDVLNFLGIIKLNLSEYETAANYFRQVINIYDTHSEAHYNLGLCCQKLEQLDGAAFHYQKVLQIVPQHFDAKNNLALVYAGQKMYDKAEKLLRELIEANPVNAKAQNNLGNYYFKSRNFEEAVKYYYSAVQLSPEIDYQYNLGLCFLKMDYYESAYQAFNKVLQSKPDHLFAIISLGIIATKLKSFNKAEKIFNDLIPLNKYEPEIFFNLGYCYEEQGKYELALSCYQKYLIFLPDSVPAAIRSAYIISKLGKLAEAKKIYNALPLNDDEKELAFTEMGYLKLKGGNVQDGLSFFEDALKIKPDSIELHYGRAHCQLLLGNFKTGWEEYEWRIKRPEFPVRNLKKPRLTNQNINGKKILVYSEQGLGDSIQFVRYLPMLKEKGAYIIFECSEYLFQLLKDFKGYDQRIDTSNVSEDELDYDYHIPILSLPFYFSTEMNSIPCKIPYIKIEDGFISKWKKIFKQNEKFKIGLVWAGNPKHKGDKERSCPLEKFQPIIDREDVEIYSLQLGPALEQLSNHDGKIRDLKEYNESLKDAAAAILNLDLLITVDTSIAHLAGALGKEVWTLISVSPDWRWLLDRNDTPWYPSMKLYRQSRPYDWVSVIDRMNKDLDSAIENKKNNYNKNLKSDFIIEKKVQTDETIYLAMTDGANFGWAVCSNYIKSELSRKIKVVDINDNKELLSQKLLDGKVFHTISNLNFNKVFDISGRKNFGYAFFENELTETSIQNSKKYDFIFAGSSWCLEKMYDSGITNCDVLLQGIDHGIFYPREEKTNNDVFVIFSGGKFELRKGQDLVLRAVKVLQQKYKDVVLINAWYNSWTNTMQSMKLSRHIRYVFQGKNWTEIMSSIYRVNGLDLNRVITLPLVQNAEMAGVYSQTDVGLFPNRCEGGTNLVLMEYMACGKPAIASFNTGQRDILTPGNSILLSDMTEFKVFNDDNKLIADWEEPDFDEIISKLEYAYFNREEIKTIGQRGAQDMRYYTWAATAENLLKKISENKYS